MDARLELAALVDVWQRRESLRSEDPCPEEFHTAQSNAKGSFALLARALAWANHFCGFRGRSKFYATVVHRK
jgi:hypothetical protein